MHAASDEEIFDRAAQDDRVVVSADTDFGTAAHVLAALAISRLCGGHVRLASGRACRRLRLSSIGSDRPVRSSALSESVCSMLSISRSSFVVEMNGASGAVERR
jgi:hypothetical protein